MNWKVALPGLALIGIATAVGCGPESLSSVQGKIILETGNPFQFAGDTVEIRSTSNPSETGYGEIRADGSFAIESLWEGRIVQGAKPGDYDVRIIVADDDYEHKSAGQKAIPKKYFRYETSGLRIAAPASDVTLTIPESSEHLIRFL